MAKERGFSVSLVVPARNEAGKILRTLEAYYSHFSRNFRDFEIIVVCNNCSDNTFDVAEKFAKSRKRVIVLDFPEKIGRAAQSLRDSRRHPKGLWASLTLTCPILRWNSPSLWKNCAPEIPMPQLPRVLQKIQCFQKASLF